MIVSTTTIRRDTTADTDLIDITADVARAVAESGVGDGLAVVFCPGSTASITTIEYEPGALADLRDAIERAAPRDIAYRHDARWGDGNGYAHVRAALLGPGIAVPVRGGEPVLGTWQQVLLCDFDNRPRRREVIVQVVGQ
ncbi:MAG: YjbQ family protein [Deltaproteobacteria bacterium]|nr:MAG: YjbQ family protein [Deltaproteobacteria bacterium]